MRDRETLIQAIVAELVECDVEQLEAVYDVVTGEASIAYVDGDFEVELLS